MFAVPKPTAPPLVAGISNEQLSSHERRAAHWHVGEDWCSCQWLGDIYNQEEVEIREKVGKKRQTVGYQVYGDLVGFLTLGLTDAVREIEVDDRVIWTGNIERPENTGDPAYWRVQIPTDLGTAYIYWGRADQPVDDVLLGPLASADASLEHPAYRNQTYIVWKRLFFGEDRQQAPNTRVLLERKPRPQVGDFTGALPGGSERILGGILELMTDPIFGAGLPVSFFDAGAWETVADEIVASIGTHSPRLIRERPLADVVKEWMQCYDGWFRLEAGKIVPGYFPHDGIIPEGLTELTHHDYVGKPQLDRQGISQTVTSVRVRYRDGTNRMQTDEVVAADGSSSLARNKQREATFDFSDLLVTEPQAMQYANEALGALRQQQAEGSFAVRRAKVTGLTAGSNFLFDYLPWSLDQVSRITGRTDRFDGACEIEFRAEPGVFPLPYQPPSDLKPDLGQTEPEAIIDARIWEVPPMIAGTPAGLPVAILAKRPAATWTGATLVSKSVSGFSAHASSITSSFDVLGTQAGWAIRGRLRSTVASGTANPTVLIDLDEDNLDVEVARYVSQSADEKADDRLLLVVGNEVFSVGTIATSGNDWDLATFRARQGTVAATHSTNALCWLVYRDEISSYFNNTFVENQTRYFKLQPFTLGSTLPLDQAALITYTFRDRAPEKPVITLTQLPGGSVFTGLSYNIQGAITDVNGDLVRYAVVAAKMSGSTIEREVVLASGDVPGTATAFFPFSTEVVFSAVGTWRVIVRAQDETPGDAGRTELSSTNITVAKNPDLDYGTADAGAPSAPTNLQITAGYGSLTLAWSPVVGATSYEIHYSGSAAATPVASALTLTNSYALQNLPSNSIFYFRVRAVKASLGGELRSNWSVEVSGTTLVLIDGTFFGPATPPNPGKVGVVWFDTDDSNKIYVWNGSTWASVADTRIPSLEFEVNTLEQAITTLSATVNGNTAAITTEASIRQTETGALFSKYGVAITRSGGQNYASGFVLLDDGNASSFNVLANSFRVATGVGAALKPVFVIDGSNIYIDANTFISNLTASKLSSGTLTSAVITMQGDGAIVSSNYQTGVDGFRINGDGFSEFNNVIIRGIIDAGVIQSSAFMVDSNLNLYSPSAPTKPARVIATQQNSAGGTFAVSSGASASASNYCISGARVQLYRYNATNANVTNRFLGQNPTVVVSGQGTVRNVLSVWARSIFNNGTFGGWVHVDAALTREGTDGSFSIGVTATWKVTFNTVADQGIEFALAPRSEAGTLDGASGGLDIGNPKLSVSAFNWD